MSLTPLDRFLVLLATGLGLLLIGVLNLSLRHFQVRTRVALVTAAQVGLLAGFACCLADFKPLWYSGVLLFTVVLAWAILCTPLLAALRRRAARFFFLRGACWPALSVLGLGGVLASVGTYAWDDDTAALGAECLGCIEFQGSCACPRVIPEENRAVEAKAFKDTKPHVVRGGSVQQPVKDDAGE